MWHTGEKQSILLFNCYFFLFKHSVYAFWFTSREKMFWFTVLGICQFLCIVDSITKSNKWLCTCILRMKCYSYWLLQIMSLEYWMDGISVSPLLTIYRTSVFHWFITNCKNHNNPCIAVSGYVCNLHRIIMMFILFTFTWLCVFVFFHQKFHFYWNKNGNNNTTFILYFFSLLTHLFLVINLLLFQCLYINFSIFSTNNKFIFVHTKPIASKLIFFIFVNFSIFFFSRFNKIIIKIEAKHDTNWKSKRSKKQ